MLKAQEGSNTYRMKMSDPKKGIKSILMGYSGVLDKTFKDSITDETQNNTVTFNDTVGSFLDSKGSLSESLIPP